MGQPSEEAKLDDAGLTFVELSEFRERLLEVEDAEVAILELGLDLIEKDSLPTATTLRTTARSRVVYENAPHFACSDSQEKAPILPVDLRLPDQSEVCFVDEGRRLQRVGYALAAKPSPRELA